MFRLCRSTPAAATAAKPAFSAEAASRRTTSAARGDRVVRLKDDAGRALEPEIDRLDAALPPLKTFILPGGSPAGAVLHLARTVCRRAERRLVTLAFRQKVSAGAVVYLNRLSDLLFVMARAANARAGRTETPWSPR
jgi:cob(I)alamin adenosyltransferase